MSLSELLGQLLQIALTALFALGILLSTGLAVKMFLEIFYDWWH